jgi:glutamine amidotransferase-like uncharacterized protein
MKPKIALFLHHPRCSIQCGNGIIEALSDEYTFKIFTKHPVEKDFFDDVDLVAFPGGEGDSESWHHLFNNNGERILNFLNNGGKYLGICMGAYWAGSHYFNILEDVDAVQYIIRPNACTKRPHAKAMPITWKGEEHKMFFFDGCALAGDESKFKTIARYSNGDPMAIIQKNIGIIGCHPESTPIWYTYHSWMKNHYHDGVQHKLLLDFVNELMEK